jgi:hypothetical protein
MRGQPENPLDVGIGKKVDAPTVEKDPWVLHKPGIWRNTQTGQLATDIPENEGANPAPQTPSQIEAEVDELLVHDTSAALDWFRSRGLMLG